MPVKDNMEKRIKYTKMLTLDETAEFLPMLKDSD
jgi:hypothetical protein